MKYMNKSEIINILNKYNLEKDKFFIISGAALVLLGFSKKTKDIDICVTEEYYNYLLKEFDCTFERTNEFGKDAYMIDSIINFGMSFMPNEYEIIGGFKVASLTDCYHLKKFLNRDKDKELLEELKKVVH